MITVLIPDKGTVSYTLYAEGNRVSKPVHDPDEGGFLIAFEGCVILFYTFEDERRRKHRKAYVVSESGLSLPAVDLECVAKPVRLVYSARGRRIDLLKRIRKWIGSDRSVYTLGPEFWLEATRLIELGFDGKESMLTRARFESVLARHRPLQKTEEKSGNEDEKKNKRELLEKFSPTPVSMI